MINNSETHCGYASRPVTAAARAVGLGSPSSTQSLLVTGTHRLVSFVPVPPSRLHPVRVVPLPVSFASTSYRHFACTWLGAGPYPIARCSALLGACPHVRNAHVSTVRPSSSPSIGPAPCCTPSPPAFMQGVSHFCLPGHCYLRDGDKFTSFDTTSGWRW